MVVRFFDVWNETLFGRSGILPSQFVDKLHLICILLFQHKLTL